MGLYEYLFKNVTNISDDTKLLIEGEDSFGYISIAQLKEVLGISPEEPVEPETPEEPEEPEEPVEPETPEEPEEPVEPETPEEPEEPVETNAAYVNKLIGKGLNVRLNMNDGAEDWSPDTYSTIKDGGFDSIRIVILKGTDEYPITTAKLEKLKSVVDLCIENGVFPVIDWHTNGNWFKAYSSSKRNTFINNWAAIADYFKDYKYDEVVFELANEPSELEPSVWNQLIADVITKIRTYRDDRIIMVAGLRWGGLDGLRTLELPDDENLILTIHYYNPQWICKQNCPYPDSNGIEYAGVKWENIQPMVDNLEDEYKYLFAFQEKNNNIPVNIGEWGTVIFADNDNRAAYATLLSSWFDGKGFSQLIWEYDYDYGVMKNPKLGLEIETGWYTDVVNAIVSPDLVLKDYTSETILEYNGFDLVGDWTTYESGGGKIKLSIEDNKLVGNVTETDYNYITARVCTPYFKFEKNYLYRVSYTVSSSKTKTICHKWSGRHSSFYTYDLGQEPVKRVETYMMARTTNDNTNIEFMVGSGTGKVSFSDFKLEKLNVI